MVSLTGQLKIDVEEATLPSARKKIEDGLADIEVGAGGGLSGQLSRDVQAGTSAAGGLADDSVQIAQLEQLEDINDRLEKLAVSGGGGGGGGGGASDTVLDLAIAKRVAGTAGGAGILGGLASTVSSGAATVARRGAPSALFTEQFGVRQIGQDGEGIGPGASALADFSEDLGRDLGFPDYGDQEFRITAPSWLDGPIDVDAPEWLDGIAVDAPEWLQSTQLDAPEWLQDVDVSAPQWLEDLHVSLPPALENLLGGDRNTRPEPRGPGGGVDLNTGFPSGQTNQDPLDISLDDIGVDVDPDFQNLQREAERAIDRAMRNSSIRQTIQDMIEDYIRREFTGR
ncbi:hypothetical protein [Halobellus rufus]|uniref:hypothetical protein n=1 Tax=Halobellus rufus TaxID=1448860 RepID=UPI00067871E6|nr:hypothetical protein [Halobellus rufus]